MKKATLVYLFKDENTILLAEKKYGAAKGIWNGIGGKYDEAQDADILDTLIRETFEEISVRLTSHHQVGKLNYYKEQNDPNAIEKQHEIYVYKSYDWEGDVQETEEMRPQWFDLSEIPFDKLWPVDKLWLPFILKSGFLEGTLTYREGAKEPHKIQLDFCN